jgi:hypothetical protein
MLDSILVPKLSVQPISQTAPSSQLCVPSVSGTSACIYTHEGIPLILAIAVLIRAIRGGDRHPPK